MKISTKGRYGVRFLMDLAAHRAEGNVPLKEIARRQAISEKYLWQVVNPLKAAGLIRASSGPGGGYALARPPAAITLREVLGALEGGGGLVDCTGPSTACLRGNACAAREIWREVEEKIGGVLSSIPLSDLAEKERVMNEQGSASYAI